MRQFLLYLQYSSQYLDRNLKHLHYLTNLNCFKEYEKYKVLIENDSRADISSVKGFDRKVFGVNSNREFSGWDHGVKFVDQEFSLQDDDALIFVNDSFARNYDPSYLRLFEEVTVDQLLQPQLIGWLDKYPDQVSFDGYEFWCWIRTNCFLINWKTLKTAIPLSKSSLLNDIFTGAKNPLFISSCGLSLNYQRYIETWLTGKKFEGSKYNFVWHSANNPALNSVGGLNAKAKCIISEHLLSARVVAGGGQLFDIRTRRIVDKAYDQLDWI